MCVVLSYKNTLFIYIFSIFVSYNIFNNSDIMSENIIPEELRKDFPDVENQVKDTVPAEEAPVETPAPARSTR